MSHNEDAETCAYLTIMNGINSAEARATIQCERKSALESGITGEGIAQLDNIPPRKTNTRTF